MININKIINDIIKNNYIELNSSFQYAKTCSQLLRKAETKGIGRKLLINILDNWKKIDVNTHDIWIDLIEAEGFYPYLEKENFEVKSTSGALRKEMSKSNNLDYYLHDEQVQVKNLLDSDKNVIVSAPTSFGKSLLIEELVAERKYKNIVIIQPTLALLDETRKKLKKYDEYYNIIVRTSQDAMDEKGNLFLLTAERVMEYCDIPFIDLLIIDEFYKLSAKRDDERSDVLNNAFHMLLKRDNVKFYLLGPNIDRISNGFSTHYNAVFYKTDYSLVEQLIEERYSSSFGSRGQKKINKEYALFELLLELKEEQTMIYCSSPSRARYLSKQFLKFLKQYMSKHQYEISLVEWIEKNIHKNWILLECLNYGIAFHDGALQKHISSSIIKYFNDGKLNFLFCTSTIIEGVNTSAKNIIIFDKQKGGTKKTDIIDFFDYSNIKGRAGRMMIHYVGKVYNFNEPFLKDKELVVDIPFFEQNPIKDEVLIHLDEEDIIDKFSEQYNKITNLPIDEKIMLKKNGLLIDGQIKILNILREDIQINSELILWKGYPSWDKLEYVLSLGWNNLLKDTETTRPMTLPKLVKVTSDYGKKQNIIDLINSNITFFRKSKKYNENDILDEAIRDAFNILKHWFQYKVPKWLRTIHTLQEFICLEKGLLKKGNYIFYADIIESDFIRDNLSILTEYGIPKSAITKIEKYISSDLDENEVVKLVKKKDFISRMNFIDYEKEKIKENL